MNYIEEKIITDFITNKIEFFLNNNSKKIIVLNTLFKTIISATFLSVLILFYFIWTEKSSIFILSPIGLFILAAIAQIKSESIFINNFKHKINFKHEELKNLSSQISKESFENFMDMSETNTIADWAEIFQKNNLSDEFKILTIEKQKNSITNKYKTKKEKTKIDYINSLYKNK